MVNKDKINFQIDEKTDVTINKFKDQIWVHIFQKRKNKNLSFNKPEIRRLFGNRKKILKAINVIEKREKRANSAKKASKSEAQNGRYRNQEYSELESAAETSTDSEMSD